MFALLAAFVVTAAACRLAPVDGELQSGASEPSHVCIDACDHIYADGGWKVVMGHRHGPDCGHERVDGRWVAKKETDPLKEEKPEPAPK